MEGREVYKDLRTDMDRTDGKLGLVLVVVSPPQGLDSKGQDRAENGSINWGFLWSNENLEKKTKLLIH